MQGKPEQMIEKIVSGRVAKVVSYSSSRRTYGARMNVKELVKSHVVELGEERLYS